MDEVPRREPGCEGRGSKTPTSLHRQSDISEKEIDSELYHQIVEIVARVSGAEPSLIRPESRLLEDIGIDSLGFYEILIEADEHLHTRIPEEDLLRFKTVEDIEMYLSSHTSLDD
ncbi:acyl carrier protein [Vulcanococcus sp. Clear-D1]|uniref:acyl carrier protein n=1 Tax=Vulcanococcus sp. Clear-D1 TaxID=2766970 RepID=UPI0019CED382|nr:acyl carrier protein [Vulcanococcus sp. Clear-D1]MBD1195021.1 acyl carrier protein [Vulcanococcus sp. Clear-D1]